MDLNVADRIVVRFDGEEALVRAAQEHAAYVAGEVLAVVFEREPGLTGGVEVTIDGLAFRFTVRRSEAT